MALIGIMQGRLVPPIDGRIQAFPREGWAGEFALASTAGLHCIEWIYDCYGADVNPVGSAQGIARMRELISQSGVIVRSLCADYFIERPFVRATESERAERLNQLQWLIGQCQQLGISRIVLPFVDQSAITTPAEEESVAQSLVQILSAAEHSGVELHLETSLAPQPFHAFLARVPHRLVKVNYDSGNSASLGYRPSEEFAAYGERIGSVHIKDRKLGAGTVPLGSGDADLGAVFAGLKTIGYSGQFILQVARGTSGDELAWATHNRNCVETYWRQANDGPLLDG